MLQSIKKSLTLNDFHKNTKDHTGSLEFEFDRYMTVIWPIWPLWLLYIKNIWLPIIIRWL